MHFVCVNMLPQMQDIGPFLPRERGGKAKSVPDQGESSKNQAGSISNASLKMLVGIF